MFVSCSIYSQSTCMVNIIVNTPINASIDHREASNSVLASSTVNGVSVSLPAYSVNFEAENFVELLPGFETIPFSAEFSIFVASIGPCDDEPTYRQDVNFKDINKIVIHPNPSNGLIQVESQSSLINNIIVFSVDGKVLRNIQNENTYRLLVDITNFSNGMYIVYVKTDDGMIYSEKIIKNK